MNEAQRFTINFSELETFAKSFARQAFWNVGSIYSEDVAQRLAVPLELGGNFFFPPRAEQDATEYVPSIERRDLVRRWSEEVAIPQIVGHPELLCFPLRSWSFYRSPVNGEPLIGFELDDIRSTPRARHQWNTELRDNLKRIRSQVIAAEDQRRFEAEWSAIPREAVRGNTGLYTFAHVGKIPQVWWFDISWANVLTMDLNDYLLSEDCNFPRNLTKLSLRQALEGSAKWHDSLEKRKAKEAKKKLAKISHGDRVLIGSFRVNKEGREPTTYEVHHLRDRQALEYESLLQKHCVDTYTGAVQAGHTAIFHIASDTERWTVEVNGNSIRMPLSPENPLYEPNVLSLTNIRQMRGPCNIFPPKELLDFVNLFLRGADMFIKTTYKFGTSNPELFRYEKEFKSNLYEYGRLGEYVQEHARRKHDKKAYVMSMTIDVPATDMVQFAKAGTPSQPKTIEITQPYQL